MAETNKEIAKIFEQMGEVVEVQGGNRFRVNAFHNAARMLGEMSEDVSQFDEKQLAELHGIGKGNAQRIREYVDTGRIAEHDELMQQIPTGILALLAIPNLGPKTIAQLWQEAGVTDMATLKQKLETEAGRAKYAKRKQTVEPVFGIVKSVMGFTRFLLHGHEKVEGEWTLVRLAYNVKRLWTLQAAG